MGKGETDSDREVVLVTGGNGFLGQHIVRVIQEHDDDATEIRIIDLQPYENKLGHKERIKVETFVGDLADSSSESVRKAFSGVDCVIHAAGLVSYRYPADVQGLHDHNVIATRNVVSLCVEEGIGRLVFCSTAEVTMVPYLGSSISVIIYQTEAKATPPSISGDPSTSPPSAIAKDKGLIIPGYSSSKLRAEKIVLDANDTPLANGLGNLVTVALRPTLLYGECDQFIPRICRFAEFCDGRLIQVAGAGGKQQATYAGNAAWAHVCAKRSLKNHPESVAGLPVFITDDTHIDGTLRFIERVTGGRGPNPNLPSSNPAATDVTNMERSPYRVTDWSIPMVISYLVAFLLEIILGWVVHPLFGLSLPLSPRSALSYLGSVVFYSRLRAAISLDYEPIYSMAEAVANSSQYYARQRWMDKGKLGKLPNGDLLKRSVDRERLKMRSY